LKEDMQDLKRAAHTVTRRLLAVTLAGMLGGCCYFVPCHPYTGVRGVVVDALGKPVAGAKVSLYGKPSYSGPDGCFVFSMADRLPFTIVGSAAGYKPYTGPVRRGSFDVRITLQRNESTVPSDITWHEISREAVDAALVRCQ
jgi:hypothetical protein